MNHLLPRRASAFLNDWRSRITRRPLILRGARRVGKSSLVRLHGRDYEHFVELNLERTEDRQLFDGLAPVRQLIERLGYERGLPPDGAGALLFVDEIQESPEAIQQLRFLYEDYPELRVIAAGSLLEFALGAVRSFPVGRVEFYTLHPLDFAEYLAWTGLSILAEALTRVPAPQAAHVALLRAFHRYAMLGGMPDVIAAIAAGAELAEVRPLYAAVWEAYRADAEKYAAGPKQREVLRHLLHTAALADDRFALAGFGASSYKSREVGEAFLALQRARVLQLVYPTTALTPPLAPALRKRPRMQLLDTGLLNHARGIQGELIGIDDLHALYRGRVARHVVTQELIAQHHEPGWEPHFWVREQRTSNAEVDLVLADGPRLVGVEVKAGPQGRLRSLHQLVEATGAEVALRALRNAAGVEFATTAKGHAYRLVNVPYYAVAKWREYVAWGREVNR